MKKSWKFLVIFVMSWHGYADTQNISLDNLIPLSRLAVGAIVTMLGPSSKNSEHLRMAEAFHKLQPRIRDDVPFPCPVNDTRSRYRPKSVHSLRPGDIDVIGAIGDSLTTGQGALATSGFQLFTQNRGTALTAGGEGTWRQYVTLPNILKEFNPNLFGYSLGDSFLNSNVSQFNIAEAGAKSEDMLLMAKELITRLQNDHRVNINNDWKMITIFIGAFDFGVDMCYQKNPEGVVENHREHLTMTLRILRNNLPRTIVNVISTLHLKSIRSVTRKNLPPMCNLTYNLFCPCLFSAQFQKQQAKYDKIMSKWQQVQPQVVNHPEFDTDDFTVVLQPFTLGYTIPTTKEGLTDYSYLSPECVHLSQKQAAIAATSLWNNILEPVGRKSKKFSKVFNFKCPSVDHPYLFTRRNSNV